MAPQMRTRKDASPRPDPKSDVIDCFEPATRRKLGQIPVDGKERVREVIARSRRAQEHYRKSTFEQRRRILRRILDSVLEDADALSEDVCRDSGKTRENAMTGEIWPVCEKLRWTIAHGEEHLRPESVPSGLFPHKKARIEYHPLGVVGAIIPWNYPLQNIMNPVIPALMTGNAVVVKPSEWVAWSSARFERIFHEALEAEGFSRDVVRLVHGYAETGRAVITEGTSTVVFIGSVPNGRKVAQAAAEHLVPVVLELGGKDPYIVCEDADLEQAVHGALGGTFINCGQNCVSSERILVHDRVYADFERRAAELVRGFRQGPPLDGEVRDVGAMITPLQLEIVERLVEGAIEQGARVVTGGKRTLTDRGDFFEPTILADVTPEMHIMQEETFGPVMLLCRYRDDEEAIRIANGTSFGLSSTVMSKDLARARRIADRLEAGMTAINDFAGLSYMVPDLPFGGVRHSGYGRLNGREGLRSLCNIKGVLDDRIPLHQPNVLFPVGPNDYETFRSVIRMLYGRGVKNKLGGARGLLASLVGRLKENDR